MDHVVLLLLIMLPLTRAWTKQSVAQSTQLFLRYYHRLAAYYMSFGYLWGRLWYSSSSLILRRFYLSNGHLSTYACDRCSSSLTPLACRGLNVLTEIGSFEMDQRHLDTWIHRHVIIIIIIRFTRFWRIIAGSHHYWPLGSCWISPDLSGLFWAVLLLQTGLTWAQYIIFSDRGDPDPFLPKTHTKMTLKKCILTHIAYLEVPNRTMPHYPTL